MTAHTHAPRATHTFVPTPDNESLWRWLDIAIIASILVIVALGAEWLCGLLVREKIMRGVDTHLARRAKPADTSAE